MCTEYKEPYSPNSELLIIPRRRQSIIKHTEAVAASSISSSSSSGGSSLYALVYVCCYVCVLLITLVYVWDIIDIVSVIRKQNKILIRVIGFESNNIRTVKPSFVRKTILKRCLEVVNGIYKASDAGSGYFSGPLAIASA
uniref:Uncharacterized protein n=1 Tax=Glossina brevipalpis TaxID=37001 RepID=A0A1A9WJP0_9MUSC